MTRLFETPHRRRPRAVAGLRGCVLVAAAAAPALVAAWTPLVAHAQTRGSVQRSLPPRSLDRSNNGGGAFSRDVRGSDRTNNVNTNNGDRVDRSNDRGSGSDRAIRSDERRFDNRLGDRRPGLGGGGGGDAAPTFGFEPPRGNGAGSSSGRVLDVPARSEPPRVFFRGDGNGPGGGLSDGIGTIRRDRSHLRPGLGDNGANGQGGFIPAPLPVAPSPRLIVTPQQPPVSFPSLPSVPPRRGDGASGNRPGVVRPGSGRGSGGDGSFGGWQGPSPQRGGSGDLSGGGGRGPVVRGNVSGNNRGGNYFPNPTPLPSARDLVLPYRPGDTASRGLGRPTLPGRLPRRGGATVFNNGAITYYNYNNSYYDPFYDCYRVPPFATFNVITPGWGSSWAFNGYGTTFIAGTTFYSPYWFYRAPTFIQRNYILTTPYPYYAGQELDYSRSSSWDNDGYYGTSENTRSRRLRSALNDLSRFWEENDAKALRRRVSPDFAVGVFQDEDYAYSLKRGDFLALSNDALDKVTTVSFRFNSVRDRTDGLVNAYATHVFTTREGGGAAAGRAESANVRYTLVFVDGDWYVSAISHAPAVVAQ